MDNDALVKNVLRGECWADVAVACDNLLRDAWILALTDAQQDLLFSRRNEAFTGSVESDSVGLFATVTFDDGSTCLVARHGADVSYGTLTSPTPWRGYSL